LHHSKIRLILRQTLASKPLAIRVAAVNARRMWSSKQELASFVWFELPFQLALRRSSEAPASAASALIGS
jgi:hypothetical protein